MRSETLLIVGRAVVDWFACGEIPPTDFTVHHCVGCQVPTTVSPSGMRMVKDYSSVAVLCNSCALATNAIGKNTETHLGDNAKKSIAESKVARATLERFKEKLGPFE